MIGQSSFNNGFRYVPIRCRSDVAFPHRQPMHPREGRSVRLGASAVTCLAMSSPAKVNFAELQAPALAM